jgi:hypothetical protein
MSKHHLFKYSVTIHSDDLYLVASLRGLTWQCQESINRQIAVANTKEADWKRDGHQVTFRFTSESYRETFLQQAENLFPAGWTKKGERPNDPAKPAK